MLFLLICALAPMGLSLILFFRLRQKPTPVRTIYGVPRAGWPDVSAQDLSLFTRSGRINQPMPKPTKLRVQRFQSFDATQDYVISLVDGLHGRQPKIALKLSEKNGPEWTDVVVDGSVVAHVQTSALTSPRHETGALHH